MKRLTLPPLDIWNPDYIHRAMHRDHCSCAPDTITTPWGRVFIGHCCKRHDERYEWIWRQGRGPGYQGFVGFLCGWWLRLRLKWVADRELGQGIHDSFERDGIPLHLIPWAYREFVIFFNLPFRMAKAISRAFWQALTFRD